MIRSSNGNSLETVITPDELKTKYKADDSILNFVGESRRQIENILSRKDDRLLLIVGPCSVHDIQQAFEYGQKLKIIADKHKDTLMIVMRTYFEKPRTNIGWKGLINDPLLNNTKNINLGIEQARQLLIKLNQIQVPCGTEFLDMLIPLYYQDLISWGCIGARTTESQSHRQMASGLKMTVGFKNCTLGSVKTAIDGIITARSEHTYLDINENGQISIKHTTGNPNCHVILRGGWDGPTIKPNYYVEDLQRVSQLLQYSKLKENIMIDCSHGNSKKDFRNQPHVAKYLAEQIKKGNFNIFAIMLESNHHEGEQTLDTNCPEKLNYGISVTDGCINFETTEEVIEMLSVAVKARRDWYQN
jgi:3-deoxy-7-phosphoheptulonate synthase